MNWGKVIASLRDQAKNYLVAAGQAKVNTEQAQMMSGLTTTIANALEEGVGSSALSGAEIKSFTIRGEDGASIKGYQDNMGEPYRSGVTLWICKDGADRGSGVFVQDHCIEQLISNLRLVRNKR